jgi:hypothetical protein
MATQWTNPVEYDQRAAASAKSRLGTSSEPVTALPPNALTHRQGLRISFFIAWKNQ